jgi:transposase
MTKKPWAKDLEVLPFRWRVEQTFAWLIRSQQLSRDYERTTARGEAFVMLAMIHLMIRRLVKKLVF